MSKSEETMHTLFTNVLRTGPLQKITKICSQ